MTNISSVNGSQFINIQGISDQTIYEYFTRLNNGEFVATAELFTEQGCLTPPFDQPIQGRSAIAEYLEKEAKEIASYPKWGEKLKQGLLNEYRIQGTVAISQFVFDMEWFIQLNSAQEIIMLEVKLIASLEDLLNFR